MTLSRLGKHADEGFFLVRFGTFWESFFQLSKIRAVGIWHKWTVQGFFSDSFCLKVFIYRHGVTGILSLLNIPALLICAWSLSYIKIHLGQTQLSIRNMCLTLRSDYFHYTFLLFTDWNIYPEITSVYLKFGL